MLLTCEYSILIPVVRIQDDGESLYEVNMKCAFMRYVLIILYSITTHMAIYVYTLPNEQHNCLFKMHLPVYLKFTMYSKSSNYSFWQFFLLLMKIVPNIC